MPTLFHVVDVEWSWIRVLQGKQDFEEGFEKYNTLEKIIQLDEQFRPEVEEFVRSWNDSMETRLFYDHRPDGTVLVYAWGEVMRHTIAHHIHHIGQLSVWAREVGKQPVSANMIRKNLNDRRSFVIDMLPTAMGRRKNSQFPACYIVRSYCMSTK